MIRKSAWVLLPLIALVGCDSDDDDNSSNDNTASPLSLNVLHINDHHSHLESGSQSLTIAGQETEFSAGASPVSPPRLPSVRWLWTMC